jgi:hypothetical protein
MMRRKLGILVLAGVTVLAGTQEATRQFDGLRSSLNDLTRASLWSGLIVYAQPVSDGKLPAPQIYYLMPPPQAAPLAPQGAVLADNNSSAAPAAAEKPEAKNNHGAEEIAAANTEMLPPLPPVLEVEDAAKSELVFDKMPPHVIASHVAANARKLEKVRVYEEVARNEAARHEVARRFRQDADGIARIVVKEFKEFDAAKLNAEITRLAAVQEQLETPKLKSLAAAENGIRRLELKVLRRPLPRPERHERIKSIAPYADRRAIALPEISSIGCEKTTNATEAASVETSVEANAETSVETTGAAAGLATSVIIASEPQVAAETSAPAVMPASLAPSTSWALGCDTEPEYTK